MTFDLRIFPIIGYRMKIEIEGGARKEFVLRNRAVPGRQETCCLGVIEARGIFREMNGTELSRELLGVPIFPDVRACSAPGSL